MSSLSNISVKKIEDKDIAFIFDRFMLNYSVAKDSGIFTEFTDMDSLINWGVIFVQEVIDRGRVSFSAKTHKMLQDFLSLAFSRLVSDSDCVVIESPFAEMLYAGRTRGVVSVVEVSHKKFYKLMNHNMHYGYIRFNKSEEIEFDKIPATFDSHHVTQDEARLWWGEIDYVRFYSVRDLIPLSKPVPVGKHDTK